MTKYCSSCKLDLDTSQFNKASRRDGFQTYCRSCHNRMQRDRYAIDPKAKVLRQLRAGRRKQLDPEAQRRAELKRLYGITLEDYVEMFKNQNGVCAICFKECKTKKSLSVDHNHESGKVRGLLCNACNRAIGMLGDSSETLRRAAEYLDS